jgi:hypothetical protein
VGFPTRLHAVNSQPRSYVERVRTLAEANREDISSYGDDKRIDRRQGRGAAEALGLPESTLRNALEIRSVPVGIISLTPRRL